MRGMKRFASYMAIVVAFCLCVSNRVFANTVTVADDTKTDEHIPYYGFYADGSGVHVQAIYPSTLLNDLADGNITALKFYSSATSINWSDVEVTISLNNVDASTLPYTSYRCYFNTEDGLTEVYSGKFTFSNGAFSINFQTPFTYEGGKNLLLDIKVKKASSSYAHTYFYGISRTEASCWTTTSGSSTGSSANFLPKTTFTYSVTGSNTCPKPKDLTKDLVTANNASFSWTAGGSETEWQYVCLPATSTVNWNSASVQTTSSTTATITGLSATTNYKFYVRAICSEIDQSGDATSSFTTPCATEVLPFSENFNSISSGIPNCWDNTEGTVSTTYRVAYYATGRSGACVRFDSYYANNNQYSFLKTPEIDIFGPAKLTFWYKNPKGGDFSVYYSLDGGTTKTLLTSGLTGKTAWTEKAIDLPAVCVGDVTFCFKGTSNYGSGDAYIYLDDILVESTVDCGKPATPTCSNLTGTSATLSWTANTGVTEYKYLYIDRTANPSAMPDWTSATNITATTVNLTGLTDGHTYDFYVMCACGTVASDACTFTPLSCPNVTGVTLSNKLYNGVTVNWTTSATANCDIRYKSSVDADWTTVATNVSATSQAITGLTTGSTYTIEVKPTCSTDGWVAANETFTPVYTAPATVNVSSITETTASASWTAVSDAASYEYIIVGRGASEDWTSPTAAASASASLTDMTLATDYDMYVRAVYANGGKSAGTKKEFSTIVNAPTVTLGSYNSESATCTWTAGGGATQYEWLCQTSTPTAANWLTANSTAELSATVTALSANTQYCFYVRATANGKYSAVAQSAAFTTPCGTEDLPFSEPFTSATQPDCWTISSGWGTSANYWTTNSDYKNTGFSLRYNAKTSSSSNLTSPPIYISDKCDFSFYIKNNYSYGYTTCKVFINDGTTDTEITSSLDISKSISSITKKTYDLSAFKGKTITVRFNANGTGTSYTSYLYIDDVAITPKTCTTPTLNTPTVTYNSATVTWTDSRAEQWSVRYRTYNTGDWTVVNDLTNKTYTMTGLTSGTEYEVQVRNDCATASSSWTTSKRFTPECKTPGTPAFSDATTDGGHVSWTAAEGVSSYQYCVVASGADADWSGNLTVNTNAKDLTGLTAGDEYIFYVRSVCATGVYSEAVSCAVAPACPTPSDVQFSNQTYNSATVSWTNGGGEDSWNLRFSSDGGTTWTNVNSLNARTHSLTGLTTNTEYLVQVQAGCGGTWAENTFTPVYTAPSTPTITNVTDVAAMASWTAVADATGYQYVVMQGSTDADWTGATSTSTTSATLSGLTAGTNYTLYVRSTYPAGGYSIATSAPFSTVYMQPANVHTTDVQAYQATIAWQQGGAETQYQYVLVEKNTAPVWTGVTPLATGVREVTIDNLDAITEYDFYVRSYYGEGKYSTAVKLSFKTACGIYEIPFTESFSANSLPECWDNQEGTTLEETYRWSIYAYDGHTGSGGCVRFNAVSNSLGYTNYLESPQIRLTDEAQLQFYWKNPKAATYKVYVSVNGGERTELKDLTATQTAWTQETISLADYSGEIVRLYFYAVSNKTSNSYAWLDEVNVSYRPCNTPTALSAVATTDGANLSWTDNEADEWVLEYRTTMPRGEWQTVSNLTATNYTLTGLTVGTQYDVHVKAVCSALRQSEWTSSSFTPQCLAPFDFTVTALTNSSAAISWEVPAQKIRYKAEGAAGWAATTNLSSATSYALTGLAGNTTYIVQTQAACAEGINDNWSSDFSFTTKCDAITITKTNPYIADFSGLSSEMPVCWEKSETTYPYVSANELQFNGNIEGQTAILPLFTNDISTLTLKFNYRSTFSQIAVGYINTSDAFVAVSTLAVNDSYSFVEYAFDGVSNAKNIALRLVNMSSVFAVGYIKDVVVELTPTCRRPASLSSATNITSSGATFTWTASGFGESSYEYICVPSGETPDWNDATKVNTLTATITGLNPQTDYDFYVRSWCADDDQSEALMVSFVTACDSYKVIPFKENFNSVADLPSCWTGTKWGTSQGSWTLGGFGGESETPNSLQYKARTTATDSADVATPNLLLDVNARLTFKIRNSYGTPTQYVSGNVVIIENGNTLRKIPFIESATNLTQTVDLTPFTGKVVQIHFRAYGANANTSAYIYIDDVVVEPYAHLFLDTEGDGLWTTADNWDKRTVPTITNDVIIRKPLNIVSGTKAMAKSVVIDRIASELYGVESRTGTVSVQAGGELIIQNTLRQAEGKFDNSGITSTVVPTSESYLYVGTNATSNGVLAIGSHEGEQANLNRASVSFYTRACKTENGWVNQFIGTPFSSGNDVYWDYYGSYLYKFDPTLPEEEAWVNQLRGMPAEPFIGYNILRKDADPTSLYMQGTLCASDNNKELSLYYNGVSNTENVLANSWIAPIDIASIGVDAFSNCEATVYLFNAGTKQQNIDGGGQGSFGTSTAAENQTSAGQFISLPVGSASWTDPVVQVIPSMQAFIVLATGDNPALTLNYGTMVLSPAIDKDNDIMTVATRAPKRQRNEEGESATNKPDIMRLHVEDLNGRSDILYLLVRNDFTQGFDNGYDGRKMFGNAENPQLYAVSEAGQLSVDCVPEAEGTIVGFNAGEGKTYRFTFTYDGWDMLYLNDLKAEVSTLISDESEYVFEVTDEAVMNRFIITASPLYGQVPTVIDGYEYTGAQASKVRKVMIDGIIYILKGGNIYTVTGVKVR